MAQPLDPQNESTLPMAAVAPPWPVRPTALNSALSTTIATRILAGVLLAALTVASFLPVFIVNNEPHPAVTTAHIGDIILSLHTSGPIAPTMYQADFLEDGVLSEIDVSVGQEVKLGDTLAKLDPAPFQNALVAAQNSDASAQSSLSAAQTAQDQAQAAVDSANSALGAHQSNEQTQCAATTTDTTPCANAQAGVAQAQAQLDASRAQLAAAQAQVAKAQATESAAADTFARAQAQLATATLTAPHDGVIASIDGAVGGRPGATPHSIGSFITIADMNASQATALINYRDIGEVRIGQAATFRVGQASPSATFTGAVTGVSPNGQGTGVALSYPITLRIDPTSVGNATLRAGMTATIRIITRARYHVIVIANGAAAYARDDAPSDGSGVLTRAQITGALASAHTMEASLIASGFDVASDPLTASYLVGFAHGQYVAIPVVLGLSDGSQTEVVEGLATGRGVVTEQRRLVL